MLGERVVWIGQYGVRTAWSNENQISGSNGWDGRVRVPGPEVFGVWAAPRKMKFGLGLEF